MNNGRALVDMRGVSISFGPVQVLNGVNFDIRAGEVHALMGENGAGKSTLMKILTGIYRADNGIVEIDGRPAEVKSPTDAQKLGIAIIHQELNLLPEMTVAENFFLGREWVKGGVLQKKCHARCRQQAFTGLAGEFYSN